MPACLRIHGHYVSFTVQKLFLESKSGIYFDMSAVHSGCQCQPRSLYNNCVVIPDDFPGYPCDALCVPKHYEDDLKCVLIPHGLVGDRIERLARDIVQEFGSQPLSVLCVLKGGYKFFSDLLDKIRDVCQGSGICFPLAIDFIRMKSYVNEESKMMEIIGADELRGLKGKNVLVVEDIIDTGRTMQKLLELLGTYKPRTVKVATLLLKRTPNSSGYRPDFLGFEVPNEWIVGYAIDYNELFRDMRHIAVLNENGKRKYAVVNGASPSTSPVSSKP